MRHKCTQVNNHLSASPTIHIVVIIPTANKFNANVYQYLLYVNHLLNTITLIMMLLVIYIIQYLFFNHTPNIPQTTINNNDGNIIVDVQSPIDSHDTYLADSTGRV